MARCFYNVLTYASRVLLIYLISHIIYINDMNYLFLIVKIVHLVARSDMPQR
jgi:hypothetical protein